MKRIRRILAFVLVCSLVIALTACGSSSQESAPTESVEEEETTSVGQEETTVTTALAQVNNGAWLYEADDDVYYQIGISYCESPADSSYETLSIFVPGAYLTGTANGDGTYTCTLTEEATVNGYTAVTAPIVMPINTPGYSAQSPLTSYTDVSDYTDCGFVYVHAGCRGRDAGAPAGVTDLKAAVRYLRYNTGIIPGDTESIFSFGMSGGGAQSAVLGATGDSVLYTPYLDAIGAVQGVSDSICGAMCWCPITNLDTANEAYEWMMGVTRSDLSEEEQAISDALAEAYAKYVNEAGFTDEQGNVLTLNASAEGIYQAGSYFDYMKETIEGSLEEFLRYYFQEVGSYDVSSSSFGGFGGGEGPSGERPSGERPSGEGPQGNRGSDNEERSESDYQSMDNIARTDAGSSGLSLSGTYESAQDYINALNANGDWVSFDEDNWEVTITDIASFVKALKNASKSLGAFDQLDAGQGENTLFGYGDGSGAHFDSTLASILEKLDAQEASAYAEDLVKTDAQGNTAQTRLDMYTPLYYLLSSSEGYGTSTVAQYWRIRTGVNQSDCALATEMNLALALDSYEGVDSVDFATIWGQGHTQAELSGDSKSNFIQWVQECTN